jgi:ankyrin repeat protein/predicted Ser/Thr protein kinase
MGNQQSSKKGKNNKSNFRLNNLQLACINGNIERLRQLIQANPAWVNMVQGKHDPSPLFLATYHGHADVVAELIAAGADLKQGFDGEEAHKQFKSDILENKFKFDKTFIRFVSSKRFLHPLHVAAYKNHTKIVDFLVSTNKIDVNIRTIGRYITGQTPLHFAFKEETVKCLIDHNANPHALDNYGYSILCKAVACSNDTVVEYLLKQGADPNRATHRGKTPLMLAAEYNDPEAKKAKLLVKYGAKIDTKFELDITKHRLEWLSEAVNMTALFGAVWSKKKELVQFLLECGADTTIAAKRQSRSGDMQEFTPLQLAQTLGLTDIAELIQKAEQSRKKDNKKASRIKSNSNNEDPETKEESKPGAITRPLIPHSKLDYVINYGELTFGEEIGRGGYGMVFKAKWQHETVAVKQLLINNFSDSGKKEFQKEAIFMAGSRSNYLVRFKGYCVSPQYCLVMEYMPKGSLYSVLHSNEPLGWKTRYTIAKDIACGVAYLHKKNILHRDIKSLNVLLDENYRAKLTDFGLSKIKKEAKTTSTTHDTKAAGTLAWMAPELFKRQAKYTRKSDIYSMAIVFWELAARKLPFADAQQPSLIMGWVLQGERDTIPEDCPKKFASLIKFCWMQDPNKRPDADKVVEFLDSDQQDFEIFSSKASASSNVSGYLGNLHST